jgi:nitroimidazol reductase NimA-like FMN-containing flavoprotein (pyridoxamine 5'-phosphate oxidase superfamily)
MKRSARTTVQRHPERGTYEKAVIYAILDEGFLCHVGFVHEGQPFVIPTLYVRIGDALYLHGSPLSRMLGHLADGAPLCVTVTLLDGLVLARSVFAHSVNYRSVVILGRGWVVTDVEDKRHVLRALVDHVLPGRSTDARAPNDKELATTAVIAIPLHEASAKVRTGPPKDARDDYALSVWAGEIPLALQALAPIPDPKLATDIPVPDYVRQFIDHERCS